MRIVALEGPVADRARDVIWWQLFFCSLVPLFWLPSGWPKLFLRRWVAGCCGLIVLLSIPWSLWY